MLNLVNFPPSAYPHRNWYPFVSVDGKKEEPSLESAISDLHL